MPQMFLSSYNMLATVAEIAGRRKAMVEGAIQRVNFNQWRPTPHEMLLIRNARELHLRFASGDYRHSEDEAKLLLEYMEWLVFQDASANGQEPQLFEYKLTDFYATKPCVDKAYMRLMWKVQNEWPVA